MEKQVQLKIKSKRRLVDKSWLGRDEINYPNHQRKTEQRTNSSVQKDKKTEDEKQSNANPKTNFCQGKQLTYICKQPRWCLPHTEMTSFGIKTTHPGAVQRFHIVNNDKPENRSEYITR